MMRLMLILATAFFLVSAMCSGVQAQCSCGGVWLERLLPDHIGNKGKVTVNVIGGIVNEFTGEKMTKTPFLNGMGHSVPGTVVRLVENAYTNPGGSSSDLLGLSFDISEAIPTGQYFVSLTDENDPSCVVDRDVTVEESTASVVSSSLWVFIDGYNTARVDSETDYTIWYGNRGNTDIAGILFIGVPQAVAHNLGFSLSDFKLDSFNPAYPRSQQNDVDVEGIQYTVYTLFIQNIPAVSLNPLKITIQWGSTPQSHLLKAWWAGSKS